MTAAVTTWGALVLFSLATGFSLVGTMAVRRLLEPAAWLVLLVSFAGATWSIIEVGGSGAGDGPRLALYAVAFSLAAAAGGYGLAASMLLEPAARLMRRGVRVEPVRSERSGPCVIAVATAEPTSYSTLETACLLSELAAEDRLDASMATLPLLFFAQKARYNAIGGLSPARQQFAGICDALAATLRDNGAPVAWASTTGPRRAAVLVAEAVRAGHDRIVVVSPALSPSASVLAALSEIDALRLADRGVRVAHARSLGPNPRLALMVAGRVLGHVTNASDTGVVLVGHGRPEVAARRDRAYDEIETTFLNRVRAELVDRGLESQKVRLAWAEWEEPDVTSTVRHVAALGCRRIVICPAVHPFDSLATRLDLEIAVRQARLAEDVSTITLGAWGDDEALIAEVRARVVDALEETATAQD